MSQHAADELEGSLANFRVGRGHDACACRDANRYLCASHEFVQPADQMPVDEYAERLDHARRVQAMIQSLDRSFQLSTAMFSAMMLAPMYCLRAILVPTISFQTPASGVYSLMTEIKELLRNCKSTLGYYLYRLAD